MVFLAASSLSHLNLMVNLKLMRTDVHPLTNVCSYHSSNSLSSKVASSKSRLHQLRDSFLINFHKRRVSVVCSAKFPGMEYFNEPTKLIILVNYTKEKFWKFVPGSLKHFPWKKAESVALHESLVLAREALKWSLLAWFAFSCLSDILYSISRNRELVIPFGLFVGILVTKFFDEISRELMPDHKDGHRRLLGISCIFVLAKVISTYFLGVNDFPLHAANGGLLQVLWNWKELPELDREKSSYDDVSNSINVDN